EDTLPASSLKPLASTLVEPLTERELEILQLIALGLSNQAIAERLIIALSTVKRHINNLFGKLAVQSRTQALLRARELQLRERGFTSGFPPLAFPQTSMIPPQLHLSVSVFGVSIS